jgi:hypothetical protein
LSDRANVRWRITLRKSALRAEALGDIFIEKTKGLQRRCR